MRCVSAAPAARTLLCLNDNAFSDPLACEPPPCPYALSRCWPLLVDLLAARRFEAAIKPALSFIGTHNGELPL